MTSFKFVFCLLVVVQIMIETGLQAKAFNNMALALKLLTILFASISAVQLKPFMHDNEYLIHCNVHWNASMNFDYGLILINGKHLYSFKETKKDIIIRNVPPNNRYSVAIYS